MVVAFRRARLSKGSSGVELTHGRLLWGASVVMVALVVVGNCKRWCFNTDVIFEMYFYSII